MSIFALPNETEFDLSDEGLLKLSAAEGTDGAPSPAPAAAAEPAAAADADAPETRDFPVASDTPHDDDSYAWPQLPADPEGRWQQATAQISQHWPQAAQDMPAVVAQAARISARWGDPGLWQRSPDSLLREAAIELYGLPQNGPSREKLAAALQQAHSQGEQAALTRQWAKAGLAPPRSNQSAPPPLTEEQKIIRDMAAARVGGIF